MKTCFHNPVLAIWQMKDYKERNNFILRTTFLEMVHSHAKMRLKSAPQKLNLAMTEAIPESYTLGCSYKFPYMFPHSCA